ncbi:hypothetical protein SAMN05443999_1232 [Roseovarius azorensis]|uniref:Uncharacterized protein n=1 Tax=Roseovarius azorensis TaxID=1287727 RepID=A0A1H7XSE0_9RHOB|nr:hypothetical protein [Roseovarius azorensis]SEM36047.1 hypothetical protein SAMN05443999_1232 [Roseovarius azorensis]
MMTDRTDTERLERHALVMAFWVPAGFVAACLLRLGYTSGLHWWTAAGFAVIMLVFVGHIIINVTTHSTFTVGETALGAVIFSVALVALLLTRLTGTVDYGEGRFMAFGFGLAALLAAVILYMLIDFGPRRAFERFDVIRDNNPRRASFLPHRGGRR